MKKLFWGFLFIYLNFNLNFNQHSLNVLPDFVGYIFLLQGARILEDESEFFSRACPFATGMTIYSAILWIGALLGVTSEANWITRILGIISVIVSLYVSWLLIRGVQEMEERHMSDLNGGKLMSLWKGLAVVQIAGGVIGLMINLMNVGILAVVTVVLAIVGFVLIVLYLIAWNKSAAAFETAQSAPNEPGFY